MNVRDIQAPPSGPACLACSCRMERGEISFIAGVTYALQRNATGILIGICQMHREMMARGHAASIDALPMQYRRGHE